MATKPRSKPPAAASTLKRRPARAHLNTQEHMAAVMKSVMAGGIPKALDMHLLTLTPKKVTAEMRISATQLNYNGRVNGGAMMAFGDIVGAAGAVAVRPHGYRGGTVESKTNFFAAATGPVLTAVSVPLHVGRTTSVWQTTIKDTDGRTVAMVTQTQIALPADSAVVAEG